VGIPFVSASQLREAMPMVAALDVLEAAFRTGAVHAPPRQRFETVGSDLLVMPAWDDRSLGVKLVTVNHSNRDRDLPLIHGVYVLFDGATSAPVALVDAEELTRTRTAAVSALATRHLADTSASELVVFGAGTQADGHIEAMCSIAPIRKVTVVARSKESARLLAEKASERSRVEVVVGEPSAVATADIVCTCTTSATPVFEGNLLKPTAHVNAIGSYRPDARELDDMVMRRATSVGVETRSQAMVEAGDVVLALESGALDEGRLVELSELVSDPAPRREPEGITVFKSVGMAMEDLVVAQAAVDRLKLQWARRPS
jgi:ornithine cyclodeaminase